MFAAVLAAGLALAQSDAPKAPTVIEASSQRKLGAAHFEIDNDSNSLIVTTDEETNETIKRIIAELDRPVPQALINVVFVEVTYTDDLDLGAEFGYTAVRSGDTLTASTAFTLSGLAEGGALTLLNGDLNATLKALAEKTKTEILSRPSIMARNNEESTITIGSEVPFVTNSQISSDSGAVTNTVEYEDIGIILTVTPHINADGMVEMDVAPEISSLSAETVTISESVKAATFDKRSAETRVVVPSGKTVVIGGLMQDKATEEVVKVPLLGDIWGVGRLFQRRTTTTEKTELLIFLTPHVVTGTSAPSLVEAERRAVGVTESVAPEKIERYYYGTEIRRNGETPAAPPSAR
jgi:general secretion pathway protein D